MGLGSERGGVDEGFEDPGLGQVVTCGDLPQAHQGGGREAKRGELAPRGEFGGGGFHGFSFRWVE